MNATCTISKVTKNVTITLILALSTFFVHAQHHHQIVTTYPNATIHEIYYVLKGKDTVKHGAYYSFYDGELTARELKLANPKTDMLGFIEKGHYDKGLKDGHWIRYKKPKQNSSTAVYNAIIEEGSYKHDHKTGIWKTYTEEGRVIKQFNFDTNDSLPPIVKVKIEYPPKARQNKAEGTVTIKVIYENCEPVAYEIMKDIGYGCGEAVVKALKTQRELERKYGIPSKKCGMMEERTDFPFRLER
ncbi:toxin-antitoxin system YwqK family antitoxin [Chryseolinea lacunae]|uniref:TonB C-terminal domain-containing protein n=1 Tax=Chryseolinea lacunae TaxID=2801331 RepID=A0ABS1KX64_9BACT|nr:hypothetical protein [Chryseolinea lacunae]MBL0743888.1 hypothetical protein [Chryseolinea lacunae]